MWCIPPKQDAAFVAAMEQVFAVYQRPYDPRHPVVCMDEQPIQLVSHSRNPLPMRPGDTTKVDYEYIRQGMCNAFMFVEPLGQWREVHVNATKKALDWAGYIKWLVDLPRFAEAERITMDCDNLITHALGSLYLKYSPEEAFRIVNRLELVFTPKHGSWLNMAEPELSVMTRQCFTDRRTGASVANDARGTCASVANEPGGRVASQDQTEERIKAWYADPNQRQKGINWQFTNPKARLKLKRLYPKIELN